jgi:1-acyl-sn-glycerol-3-phosphate acyltransferase
LLNYYCRLTISNGQISFFDESLGSGKGSGFGYLPTAHCHLPIAHTALIARGDHPSARDLLEALRRMEPSIEYELVQPGAGKDDSRPCIYLPAPCDRYGMTPDLLEAEEVFQQCAQLGKKKLVLLSSALIYGTGPGRQSLADEAYGIRGSGRSIARQWKSLEALAGQYLQGKLPVTVLRPVTVLPSSAMLSRRLLAPFSVTIAGHDPVVQLLSLADLAQAVLCALEHDRDGVFNVAPDSVVPLRAAIRMAGGHRVALPVTLQRIGGGSEALEYLRYPWTVSNQKIKRELEFSPQQSSLAALREHRKTRQSVSEPEPSFDEFGLDRDYIEAYRKRLLRFLCDSYWRIEARGLEHIPRQGPAILVGMHRGFVPFDGVMALHLVMREAGRVPRFLTHPGLMKFPFIDNFVRKFGGVVACEASADRVLESGGLLGVFPEGVDGAFALYRQAYRLKDFGRDSFVKLAVRHRAPIIPFVTVGSAEILPIFVRIKSRLWTRCTDWPWLPLSTFPWLPFPLPSRWHMRFLPPIQMDNQHQQEPAQERSAIKAISLEVQTRMQQAVEEMIQRRKSVFFGSVFEK